MMGPNQLMQAYLSRVNGRYLDSPRKISTEEIEKDNRGRPRAAKSKTNHRHCFITAILP